MPIVNSVRGTFGSLSQSQAGLLTGNSGSSVPFRSDQTQYFSSGFFGVDTSPSYILRNGSTLQTITYRRVNTGSYSWWFNIVTKSGNTYTPIYGAVITTPSGGTVGEVLTFDLGNATINFGSRKVPTSGTYYIGWHSGTGGYPGLTAASGKIYSTCGDTDDTNSYNVYPGNGSISWRQDVSTYPQLNTPWTATTTNVRSHIAISVSYTLPGLTGALDGSTPERAAVSALAIKNLTGTTTNGWYWIKPIGISVPRYVYCDMNTNGGGWMLMSWISANVFNNFHVTDAEVNSLSNGGCTTITTTVPTANSGATHGLQFINSIVENNRGACVASYRLSGSGTNSFYFNTDSNSSYLRYFSRSGMNSSNHNLAGNQWLKTCNTGYSTSGGGGAGSATGGTSISYGGLDWGVFPFNMNNGYSGNWGSAISHLHSTVYPTYATNYASGHNNGWGQSVAMWLKSV